MYTSVGKFLVGFYISFLIAALYGLLGLNQVPYYFILLLLISSIAFVVFKRGKQQSAGADKQTVDNDIFFTKNTEESGAERQLNSPTVKPLRYYRAALVICLVVVTLAIAGYYIYELATNSSKGNTKVWQSGAFFISLGIACIYYLYNIHKFKTIADKVTFFSGFALGPPTALGFMM